MRVDSLHILKRKCIATAAVCHQYALHFGCCDIGQKIPTFCQSLDQLSKFEIHVLHITHLSKIAKDALLGIDREITKHSSLSTFDMEGFIFKMNTLYVGWRNLLSKVIRQKKHSVGLLKFNN